MQFSSSIYRVFDFLAASIILIIFSPIFILVSICIKLTSPGPVLFWSNRIGFSNKNFHMPKFRTMKIDTPQLATHLLGCNKTYLTKVGHFLRKSSLDELPQLLSILKGDMSFVGPRPALFNQYDLIEKRTNLEIHLLKPGLTGWAQVNGRDELSIDKKVELDLFYLRKKSLQLDLKILYLTVIKVL